MIWLAAPILVAAVTLSAGASYLLRTVTALTAAYVLLRGAHLHRDGLGRSRRFFAAALLAGGLSGLIAVGYLGLVGRPVESGYVGDWIYLLGSPLAVIGILAVPRSSASRDGTVRAVADGAVVVGSLWYIAMVLLVDDRGMGTSLERVAPTVTLAQPLLAAFTFAVILSALPRVSDESRPFLHRAAAGVSLNGFAVAAFGVVSAAGTRDPTSWMAGVSMVGLLLLLDAAFVAAAPAATSQRTESEADLAATRGALVVGAPYAPLAVALAVAAAELVQGRGIPPSHVAPLLLIGSAVVVRHVASALETSRLVTRIAAREHSARTLARTDSLTGLANRTEFIRALDAALSDPASHPVAVALLDLNDFKDINDTHGHDIGDEVLRHTADRLNHAVPLGGVARLGGDEFAAFVLASPDNGSSFAREIVDAFAEPMRVGASRFHIRPSVGVVVDERPVGAARPGDASYLLAHADVAMYQAKKSKAVQDVPVAVLTGAARASAAATIRLREEISSPDLTQFRVEYQPIVDLQTGAIISAEALLRWTHPGLGDISPAVFIPLAEHVGSVAVLGDYVLTLALDDLARWSAAGSPELGVCVNMSPRQLTDRSLAATVIRMVADRGLAPQQVALEVTEEAFVDDLDSVVETIAALRGGGISVSVDDFGTGYSSLRYLRRFDANIVKIDREFVQAISSEPRTEALVRSVISMADALGLVCVAEGIETLEQLALVRSHGCRLGQGFLLARPMEADALAVLLATGHAYPVDVSAPPPTTMLPLQRGQVANAPTEA